MRFLDLRSLELFALRRVERLVSRRDDAPVYPVSLLRFIFVLVTVRHSTLRQEKEVFELHEALVWLSADGLRTTGSGLVVLSGLLFKLVVEKKKKQVLVEKAHVQSKHCHCFL